MSARGQTTSNIEQQTTLDRSLETNDALAVTDRESRHDRVDSETITEHASDEEIITSVREYDTGQPVDSATGTPPLKREITQTRRKVDTGHTAQTTGRETGQERESVVQADERRDEKTTSRENASRQEETTAGIETSERRGMNAVQRTLCVAGGFVILGGLLFLIWRLKKRL